jgi:regulator-associated protein of mTOR
MVIAKMVITYTIRFATNSLLVRPGITFELIDQIPGRLTDRRTPIGELNWIFTAVTDTIAWNLLPRGSIYLF